MSVNPKLLTVNDCPLKLYLDGFEVLEFLRTAAIIQLRGGKVTRPDWDTVVLSSKHRISGTQSLSFNIQWLWDSILKDELQDVGKYLLSTSHADSHETPTDDIPVKTDGLKESNAHQSQSDQDDMSEISINNSSGKRKGQSKLNEVSSAKRKRWSVDEDQKLIHYLFDNDLTAETMIPNTTMWKELEEANINEFPRSALSLQLRFKRILLPNINNYVDDPEILKAFEGLDPKKPKRT